MILLFYDLLNHQFWEAPVRESMDSTSYTLLERAHGALNLTNVLVRGDRLKMDRVNVMTNAGKLMVGVQVANAKATGPVEVEDGLQGGKHGAFAAGRDVRKGAKTNVASDGVEETHLLNEKKIHTKGEVGVVGQDMMGHGQRAESGDMRGRGWARGFSFEGGNVWAVDGGSTADIICSDWTVPDVVSFKEPDELGVRGASEVSRKEACIFSRLQFASGEQRLVVGNGGEKRIRVNHITNRVNITRKRRQGWSGGIVDVQSVLLFPKNHEGAIKSVDTHCGRHGGVHGDPAHAADIAEGEDVGNRGVIEPHPSEVLQGGLKV
jgi:hypothetical protein